MARRLVLVLLFLLVRAPGSADATPTGSIEGKVRFGKEPAVGANVVVLGTHVGANADLNGHYRIDGLPVGRVLLRVSLLGADSKQFALDVNAGPNAAPTVDLVVSEKAVKEFGPVVIRADRDPIDLKTTESKHRIDRKAFDVLKLDDVQTAVARTPGIVLTADGMHVRGGRVDELVTLFDGVPATDALGGRAAKLGTGAVAAIDVRTGGLDAEYGTALSGVVNVTTREGADTLAGDLQWRTDRYGESGKTYDNYDRLTLGLGGPTPVKGLTWFLAYEGAFSDTYLHARRTQPTRSFFDFLRLGNRQSNETDTNAKLAWRLDPARKVTVEVIANRSLDTPYSHMWSRQGWVSVTYDTATVDGALREVPVYGRWSAFKEDSTYVPENLADHVPTTDARFTQWKAVWTDAPTKDDVWTMRLSRTRFTAHAAVAGKEPWEYDTQSPLYWSGNLDTDPYFVTHGDYPTWRDQATTTWNVKADWTTTRWKGHTAKAGVEGAYNAFALVSMQFPNQQAQGLPGLNRSDFTNYNPEGSAFAQDRWEYEGLVLNAGMRYDLFTPGAQVPGADLPHGRYKGQLSPRLGIAYPISDRDVLSFHYGWTFQTPARNFVFENRGSQSTVAVRGNPDLAPETNVSYQAAVQHKFSEEVFGQFALFFKDIFGLISVRQEIDPLTGLLVPVYVNRDYASSRGFEASVTKRLSRRFSAEVNYTFAIASGVASDPNAGLQFAQGNALYLPIAEQALDWDQRHTLNADLVLRDPGKWGLTVQWAFASGLPYTPTFRNDRKPDPRYANTRRRPSSSTLSVSADRFFRIWGRNVTFFLDARNVLDAISIVNLAPDNFPNPYINQIGSDYLVYYTETGRAGGAYLKDVNGDRVDDWVPVRDPRVFGEGRNVRVGVGVAF